MLTARLVSFILITLFAGGMTALAQEATPAGGFDPTARFPAQIHAGTCQEPGEIVWDLAEGGFGLPMPLMSETPSTVRATYVGRDAANPAIVSVTTLDATLDDLVAQSHVIDAHTSADDVEEETRIVCGVVGGFLAGDDLVFGLEEANDSRYGGTAWLHANDDGSTTVTLFLVSGLAHYTVVRDAPSAVEEAEPLGGLPPVVEVAGVIIEDAAFSAEQLTLHEGIPTVVHIVNGDDEPFRLRIEDMVSETELPPNQLTVLEFTTPTWGTFEAHLLDASGEEVLDTYPVIVVPTAA